MPTVNNIHELEQLYDLVVSHIEANPAMTWDDICSIYPQGVLIEALQHAHLFGAEDSARHHFVEFNNKRYLKQEWDKVKLHVEIQELFIKQQTDDYATFFMEEGVEW